jgi:hypothetical protein
MFAGLRGVVLAGMVLVALFFMRGESSWRSLLSGLLLLIAVFANVAVGGLEFCWSITRAVSGAAGSSAQRHIASAAVRASCAALPLIAFSGGHWLLIPDRSFVWRHRAELEAVVRGADPKNYGFMDVYRHQSRTVIQVCEDNITDCYWIIYDTSASPADEDLRDEDSFLRRRRSRIDHVWGPWYALIS